MTEVVQKNIELTVTEREIEIINKAADKLLAGERTKSEARESVAAAEKGQLAILKETLADFPGVVTEEVWDTFFKANVADRLRYSPSKDTLVNRLKRATMGLTLAKEDRSFEPGHTHTNLKKYADWVGLKLQNTVDPLTGKPRLKSIKAPAEKVPRLPAGQTYWLLGATQDKAQTVVIGDDANLSELKKLAKRLRGQFKQFWFIVAPKPEPLEVPQDEEVAELHQNTAVFAASLSFETA